MGQFAKFVYANKSCHPTDPMFHPGILDQAISITPEDSEDADLRQMLWLMFKFVEIIEKGASASVVAYHAATRGLHLRRCIGEASAPVAEFLRQLVELQEVPRTFGLSPPLQGYVSTASGMRLTIDEMAAAITDALERVVRWHTPRPVTLANVAPPSLRPFHKPSQELLAGTHLETLHRLWLECLLHNGRLVETAQGAVVRAVDEALAIQQAVSIRRREHLQQRRERLDAAIWNGQTPSQHRERCGIQLADSIVGDERVSITLGTTEKGLTYHLNSILQHEHARAVDYAGYLSRPVPSLGDATLEHLLQAHRFVQSVAHAMLCRATMSGLKPWQVYAPLIPFDHLVDSVARALNVPLDRAERLVDALTFQARDIQTVWLQPLFRSGADVVIVATAAVAPQLKQWLEGWIDTAGFPLSERGIPFENACRTQLAEWGLSGPLARGFSIASRAFNFRDPLTKKKLDIDGLMVIGRTAVVIEVKCVRWPETPHSFKNYHDDVLHAVGQLKRRLKAMRHDLAEIRRQWPDEKSRPLGVSSVIGCVLTSSFIHSGFAVDGIAVVDLPILEAFLKNRRWVDADAAPTEVVTIYANRKRAEMMLESYLLDPPDVADLKSSVQRSSVDVPFQTPYGTVSFDAYAVGPPG